MAAHEDDDCLRETFDVVVVGTGLTESIVAAALARAGKKVMHIDQNEHYGGPWAMTTPRAFGQWARKINKMDSTSTNPGTGTSTSTSTSTSSSNIPLSLPGTYAPFVPSSHWNIPLERSAMRASQGDVTSSCNDTESATSSVSSTTLPVSRDSVGELVMTQFGLGVVTGYRTSDNMLVVCLDWELSNKSIVKMHCLPSMIRRVTGDNCRCKFRTVFGTGRVVHVPSPYSSFSYEKIEGSDGHASSRNSMPYDMCSVELQSWRLANGKFPTLQIPVHKLVKTKSLQHRHKYFRQDARRRGPPPSTPLEHVFYNDRRFSLDLAPHLMLCRGAAVDALVRSGVHKYVEFISVDQIFVAKDFAEISASDCSESSQVSSSHSPTRNAESNFCSAFQPPDAVPCSKADVFKSRSLSMLDKRVLMKFLRFCIDVGISSGGTPNQSEGETGNSVPSHESGLATDLESLRGTNERMLGKGRSLTRPQNAPKLAYPEFSSFCEANRPFSEFLEHCRMGARLKGIVAHAIGFLGQPPSRVTTREGVTQVQRVLGALGRFGTSPFLCTVYGNSELPQAFCRMCAVYGGIYMLRVQPKELWIAEPSIAGEPEIKHGDAGVCTGIILSDGRKIRANHVVLASEYLKSDCAHADEKSSDRTQQLVVCRCLLVTKSQFRGTDADAGRSVVVIPPKYKAIRNTAAIFAVQMDKDACVTPQSSDYYVVNLSTTVEPGKEADGEAILRRAVWHLYGPTNHGVSTMIGLGKTACDATSFVHPKEDSVVWSGHFQGRVSLHDKSSPGGEKLPVNVYRVPSSSLASSCGVSIDLDAAFVAAEQAFGQICPGEKFLPARDVSNSGSTRNNADPESDVGDDSDFSGLDDDEDYGI